MCVISMTSSKSYFLKPSAIDENLTVALPQIFFKTSVFVR